MITEVRIETESFGDAPGRRITGSSTLEVNMVFRNMPGIQVAFMEAQNMSEADGLRHIAAAIDTFSEPPPDPRSDHRPEPPAQPRK